MKSDLGIIGLGVMGRNLSRNFGRNGFRLSLYNRRVEGLEEDIALSLIEQFEELKSAAGFEDLELFVKSLQAPRVIILMVTAGEVVDKIVHALAAFSEPGDTLIDGGNSYFRDSDKRNKWARDNGLNWVSMGVSGGAEGALMGPSMMPSSDMNDFDSILEKLQKVAAKDASGLPCCIRVGGKSSGHFVKMVHNGIEYAEMQLIAEVYDLLRNALQMPPEEIADLFTLWNDGQCKSYLLEITKDILRSKDSSGLLLDEIVDVAKGKGTGTWTAITAAELGVPMPMVTAALNERFLSNSIDIRSEVSKSIKWDDPNPVDLELLEEAYHCARLVNHIQGFELIRMASEINNWGVNLSELARIWTNGCIIRSELMRELSITLKKEACLLRSLPTLEILNQNKNALIKLVQGFAISKVAMPAFSSALNYLKSIARADSAMNLIQAQRDYFGAHTYQKKGMEGIFTSDWNALR